MSERDKGIARRLAAANALNFGAGKCSVQFYSSADAIEVER
jgi:hypothetical protein